LDELAAAQGQIQSLQTQMEFSDAAQVAAQVDDVPEQAGQAKPALPYSNAYRSSWRYLDG
jgi:hypothetical protein